MSDKIKADKKEINLFKALSYLQEKGIEEEYITPKGKGVIEGFVLSGRKEIEVVNKDSYEELKKENIMLRKKLSKKWFNFLNTELKSLGRESLTDKPQQPINTINDQPQVRLQDKPSIETETD